jgi:hypothetical protein
MDNIDDAFNELMKNYQSELPSLEAQISGDLADARRRANGGIDLMPIFAQIESFHYRVAQLERQNLEFEKRIAELEGQAPSNLADAMKDGNK